MGGEVCNVPKSNLPPWVFFTFFTFLKLCKASHIRLISNFFFVQSHFVLLDLGIIYVYIFNILYIYNIYIIYYIFIYIYIYIYILYIIYIIS